MRQDIIFGRYCEGESFLHLLYPRVKLYGTLVFCWVVFRSYSFTEFTIIAVLSAAIIGFCSIPLQFIAKSVRSMLFFIIATGIVNMFFADGEPIFRYGVIVLTIDGVYAACFMMLRLMFLSIVTGLLAFSTSPFQFAAAIEIILLPFERIKLPARDIALMISIAIRFIPVLLEESVKIRKAQQARGLNFGGGIFAKARAIAPITIPLFVSAIRRADQLAIAMENRCYNTGERTYFKQLMFTKNDYIALLAISLAPCIIFVTKFLWMG